MILILCLIAPLAEETHFRGLLFRWLTAKVPLIVALVASALIFAGVHLLVAWGWDSGVVDYFATGVACAWLFQESRSLWPGILLHMMLNILFVLVVLLQK